MCWNLKTENCFLFFGRAETGSLTGGVIMNIHASETHQEGILLIGYVIFSVLNLLSHPPHTYRKNYSIVSSSQVLTLHSYFLFNISLFNSATNGLEKIILLSLSLIFIVCRPSLLIGFLWRFFFCNTFIFPVLFISLF